MKKFMKKTKKPNKNEAYEFDKLKNQLNVSIEVVFSPSFVERYTRIKR